MKIVCMLFCLSFTFALVGATGGIATTTKIVAGVATRALTQFTVPEFSEESKCVHMSKDVIDFTNAYYVCSYVHLGNLDHFKKIDVRDKFKENLSNCADGSVKIKNMNTIFGDPCPYQIKTLVILYTPEAHKVGQQQFIGEQFTAQGNALERYEENNLESNEPTTEDQIEEVEFEQDFDSEIQ